MSKEKIILSFVAIIIGLVVAGGAFYFYQSTKVIPTQSQNPITVKPSPSPLPKVLLTVDEPKDEGVYDTRIIKISGKTDPSATIVILTDTDEDVLTPTTTGDFSTTVTINIGQNVIQITAINKNGDTNTIDRTVTYSTESF